jgi:hypothetical protein
VGGSAVTPAKNENGATFRTPSADTEEIHAIGLGTIVRIMSW